MRNLRSVQLRGETGSGRQRKHQRQEQPFYYVPDQLFSFAGGEQRASCIKFATDPGPPWHLARMRRGGKSGRNMEGPASDATRMRLGPCRPSFLHPEGRGAAENFRPHVMQSPSGGKETIYPSCLSLASALQFPCRKDAQASNGGCLNPIAPDPLSLRFAGDVSLALECSNIPAPFGLTRRNARRSLEMAKCDYCPKAPMYGNNRPWSKKATRRRWNPTIQKVRIMGGGGSLSGAAFVLLAAGRFPRTGPPLSIGSAGAATRIPAAQDLLGPASRLGAGLVVLETKTSFWSIA